MTVKKGKQRKMEEAPHPTGKIVKAGLSFVSLTQGTRTRLDRVMQETNSSTYDEVPKHLIEEHDLLRHSRSDLLRMDESWLSDHIFPSDW